MKRHLKRLAAPASWNVKRRSTKFIARPFPNGQKMGLCLSLTVFMKEVENIAKTTKEVKAILQNKNVLVNGRRKKNQRDTVGFLDVVVFEESNEIFRIILNKNGQITAVKIPTAEAGMKVCKIIGKTMMKGNKLQFNLNDGQNYLGNQKEKWNVGDSLVIDLKNRKVTEHLPFQKNMTALMTAGKQVGEIGKVAEIEKDMIIVKLASGKEYQTGKEHAFIVGKEHPAITVQKEEKRKEAK